MIEENKSIYLSAAIRLRDTGQWKAQFYGHAKVLQHDKSIPKIIIIH